MIDRELCGHEREDGGIDLELRERDPRARELVRQQLRQLEGMNEATLHEQLSEAAAIGALMDQHLVELHLGDHPRIEEEPAERGSGASHRPAMIARSAPCWCSSCPTLARCSARAPQQRVETA